MARIISFIACTTLILALMLSGCGGEPAIPTAPDFPGLQKEVHEKDGSTKTVYTAKADNPYGLKQGEYAGEFKEAVYLEDFLKKTVKQTGGVALKSQVVRALVDDKLDEWDIDEPIIPVCLDISKLGSKDSVKISADTEVNLDPGLKRGSVKVTFTGGPAAVVSVDYGEAGYDIHENPEGMKVITNQKTRDYLWNTYFYELVNMIAKRKAMLSGMLVSGGFDRNALTGIKEDTKYAFGDAIASADSPVYIYTQIQDASKMTSTTLLRTDKGVLVFVIQN